jgi:hypothetical protein
LKQRYLKHAQAADAAAERELAEVPDYIWDGHSLPVPVEAIADSHYTLLVREDAGLGRKAGHPDIHVSGFIVPHKREIWVDGVEAHRAPARRRFTIGHEVGHWVLHCDKGAAAEPTSPPFCRTDTVQDTEPEDALDEAAATTQRRFVPYPMPEHEANHFGAAMLMPRALVLEEAEWCKSDVAKMARAFDVSFEAMERRVQFLAANPSR